MGEKPNYPRVSPEQLRAADVSRATTFVTGIALAADVAGLYHMAGAPGGRVGRFIQKGYSGIDVHPRPGLKPSLKIGILQLPIALLPSPVGYVPAEYYDLHPNTLENALGFHLGKHLPFVSASDVRVEVYEVRLRTREIMSQSIGRESQNYNKALTPWDLNTKPITITRADLEYLKSLPPGVNSEIAPFLSVAEKRANIIEPDGGADYGEPGPEQTGHLVRLVQPGGATVEAIETSKGNYVRIDALGRATR